MKKVIRKIVIMVLIASMVVPKVIITEVYADNMQQNNNPSIINGQLAGTVNYSLNTVTGVLTISGTGNIPDYDYCVEDYENGPEYIMYRNQIKSVVIEEGITRIGRQAFFNCENLTKITMPDTLESIGECAIESCYKIKELSIPKGVKKIEKMLCIIPI